MMIINNFFSRKLLFLFAIIIFTTSLWANYAPRFPIKQVVVWGHKLHSHTHSYVHWAFVRAFKHLGYQTYWLDKNDNIDHIDFAHTLFITEGQDQNIPLRSDCHYILHNCSLGKYKTLLAQGNCIILQVYTHDCIERGEEKIAPCMYKNIDLKTIYLPWATDLLPHEIEENKKRVNIEAKDQYGCFIGTYGWHGHIHGNGHEIDKFKRACLNNGLRFVHQINTSPEDNVTLVRNALVAPAIQGQWQVEKGYIPCRIFKNISYGALGVTNSKTVYDLFNGTIVYNPDTYQLFFDAVNKLKAMDINELHTQMDFVKTHHTYLNRIDMLLQFLDEIGDLAHK